MHNFDFVARDAFHRVGHFMMVPDPAKVTPPDSAFNSLVYVGSWTEQ
jgi:hypothetical protein